MLNLNLKKDFIPAACLILSVVLSAVSVSYAMDRSMNGQEVIVWLHVVAFFASVGLVLAAALFRRKIIK